MSSFVSLRASGHNFQVAWAPWMLHVGGSAQHGYLGARRTHLWEILQGRYVLVLLMEVLSTLGMVDLAYDPPQDARADFRELWGMESIEYFSIYDGLRYFRLNSLGAYCLGLSESYEPGHSPATLRLAGAEVEGLPNLPGFAAGYLDRVAERAGDGRWTLTREALLRAAEAGQLPADVRAFLVQQSGRALPYASERFLRSTEHWLGRCRDAGPARLLRLSPEALAEVLANPVVAKLCLRAGEHLVVPLEHEAAVGKALRKLGYWTAPRFFVEGVDQPDHLDPSFGDELIRSLTAT